MTLRAALVALLLVAAPAAAVAVDPADWPPAPAVQKRMENAKLPYPLIERLAAGR